MFLTQNVYSEILLMMHHGDGWEITMIYCRYIVPTLMVYVSSPICEQFSSSGVAEVEDNLEHPVHAEDIHGYAALGPVSDTSCCHTSSCCLSSALGDTPPECGKCGL